MKTEVLHMNAVPAPTASSAFPAAHNAIETEKPTTGRLVLSLLMRTILFFIFGLAIAAILAWTGHDEPLRAAAKWWPFQAILANIVTFLVLRRWIHREGGRYRDMLRMPKGQLRRYLLEVLWLIPVGFLFGAVPLFLSSYVILGSFLPPDTMFQPLPMWAAIVALIVFPISNGLVETPTYMGYALPRIQRKTGALWIAILFSGLALALQHIPLPIVLDGPYMLWRFVAFIPLAIAVGFIFSRTKRLLPIMIVHAIMDLQMVMQVFASSL